MVLSYVKMKLDLVEELGYTIVLNKWLLCAIFFLFFSQFEEKFEEMNVEETTPSLQLASSSGSAVTMITDNSGGKEMELEVQDPQRICSDLNASQDFVGGIMKIVPSDVSATSKE